MIERFFVFDYSAVNGISSPIKSNFSPVIVSSAWSRTFPTSKFWVGFFLLIVIENFKTAEEIDSMAPVFRSKIESSKQFENVVVYEGRKVEFGKLVVILKEDSKNSDLVIKTISEKAQGIVVWELKATQTYIIKFKVDSMQDLEKLKKEVSEIKEVEYVGFSSAYVTEPF
jgi:hypothetical protein